MAHLKILHVHCRFVSFLCQALVKSIVSDSGSIQANRSHTYSYEHYKHICLKVIIMSVWGW